MFLLECVPEFWLLVGDVTPDLIRDAASTDPSLFEAGAAEMRLYPRDEQKKSLWFFWTLFQPKTGTAASLLWLKISEVFRSKLSWICGLCRYLCKFAHVGWPHSQLVHVTIQRSIFHHVYVTGQIYWMYFYVRVVWPVAFDPCLKYAALWCKEQPYPLWQYFRNWCNQSLYVGKCSFRYCLIYLCLLKLEVHF